MNIYYVFAIESVLDVIQRIVRTNLEIATSEITSTLKEKLILESLASLTGKADVRRLGDITTSIEKATMQVTKTSLESKVNEADTYDVIRKGTSNEERLAAILVMLVLLRKRFLVIKGAVSETSSTIDEHRLVPDTLRLANVLASIDEKRSVSILVYLKYLIEIVINRHLLESTSRLSWGTKNWIFSEEAGVLYPARRDLVVIRPRDNRWSSILNLLLDTKFVRKNNGRIDLTEKGELWLSKIE